MRKVIHSNFELDLSNKKITDISENPIFSDKFSAKYTYPIEIDLEDDLDIAFGFISFYNSSDPLTYIDVLYNHNNILSPAILEVEEIKGRKMQINISWGFEEFPSFNKKLSELTLDKFEVANIYTHAAGIISQTFPNVNYNFPQIHTDKIDTDDEIWFAFEKILNNYKAGVFLENYVDLVEDITYNKNIMQPLPYLLHVLERGFLDGGYALAGTFVDYPIIKKALLYADAQYYTTFEQESYPILKMSEDAIVVSDTATYDVVTTITAPGKYRIIGKINYSYVSGGYIKIFYRNTRIFNYTSSSISSILGRYINIDVVFETLSDLLPNDIRIVTFQKKTNDKVIIDININPIRLHDISGTAIPTVLNPNQIDLARAVPDITFGELVTTLKNWFNLSTDFIDGVAYLNFVQDDVDFANVKDYSQFEVKEPLRKLQQGNSYLLKFQEVNSKEYEFLPVFHSNSLITNSSFKTDEKTTEIQINGYPLPVTFKNGIQTAHAFEQSNDKVQIVLYDGLTDSLNLAKEAPELLMPAIHSSFYSKWFDRRINSQVFQWDFLADSFDLFDKSVKDKINCYSCIHLIKSISKTEIQPEIFEVEIETEAEL